MTTAQAAQLLGVSAQTIQKWVDAGHLSAWRTVGGHRRIDIESVDRMRRQRQGSQPDAPPRVYVVDDNPMAGQLLEQQVRRVLPQAQVSVFSSGFTALVEIGRLPPDVLLADVDMPGLDGVAMVAQLRREPITQGMRIVMVSGHEPDGLARFGPLPEDVPVLRKPIDDAVLAETLRIPTHA